jgi:hypothetical protein
MDPFSEAGAKTLGKALPIAAELRLVSERALESLYRYRSRVRTHADTLDALILGAMRLDALGMKIQFAAEIGDFYWDAYRNQSDRGRVEHDLGEITGMNGRLEDLRDSNTQVRAAYSKLWLQENRPYWLGNVLVRYDALANLYQSKLQAAKEAARVYGEKGELPPPEQMGFYLRTQK